MARDDDDAARPVGRKKTFEPKPLDALSVAEIEEYILDLKGEIRKAEAAIAGKRSVRAGAESLFGKTST